MRIEKERHPTYDGSGEPLILLLRRHRDGFKSLDLRNILANGSNGIAIRIAFCSVQENMEFGVGSKGILGQSFNGPAEMMRTIVGKERDRRWISNWRHESWGED